MVKPRSPGARHKYDGVDRGEKITTTVSSETKRLYERLRQLTGKSGAVILHESMAAMLAKLTCDKSPPAASAPDRHIPGLYGTAYDAKTRLPVPERQVPSGGEDEIADKGHGKQAS